MVFRFADKVAYNDQVLLSGGAFEKPSARHQCLDIFKV